jgi:beta-glucosidase
MDRADPPAERAAKLIKAMTLDEKLNLFHGSGKGYVGNVAGNARLGIPAIKMNDGPQGFRGKHGTSTAFPCGLAIGATFDIDASASWGAAMGNEFWHKGANVQLGPGMCLARVPRNGRNFEYMSGEEYALQ